MRGCGHGRKTNASLVAKIKTKQHVSRHASFQPRGLYLREGLQSHGCTGLMIFFFSFLDNKRNCVLDEDVIAIRIQPIDSHIAPPMRMHQSLMSSLAAGEKE